MANEPKAARDAYADIAPALGEYTEDELIELTTHLAFYAGWHTANSAVAIAGQVFEEAAR